MHLRTTGNLPDLARWRGVNATTAASLTGLAAEYLAIDVSELMPKASPQSHPPEPERRSHSRYACEGMADIRTPYAGPSAKATILDLSTRGCCVETDFPFEAVRRVELMLQVNKLTFRATGLVVNESVRNSATGLRRHRVGIKFVALSSGGSRRLEELIGELKDGRAGCETG